MPVLCEKRNHVGWLTLSRPEADSLTEILFAPVVLSLLRGDRGFESRSLRQMPVRHRPPLFPSFPYPAEIKLSVS